MRPSWRRSQVPPSTSSTATSKVAQSASQAWARSGNRALPSGAAMALSTASSSPNSSSMSMSVTR
jgi:hypothetical protein